MTRDEAIRILHTTFKGDENIAIAVSIVLDERKKVLIDKMTSETKGDALDEIKTLIGLRYAVNEIKTLVGIFDTLREEAKTTQEIYAKSE